MKKTYRKPAVVAKNRAMGSFAAGCPPKNTGSMCKPCERTQ